MTFDSYDPLGTRGPEVWARYDNWRARRHEKIMARNAHRFAGLRNHRGIRLVLTIQWGVLALLLAASVTAFFTPLFWIAYAPLLVITIALMLLVRAITGSVGDAPVSALDELQLAQRNSARSIGYISVFSLMFIPYFVLIALTFRHSVPSQWVYGVAILQITLLAIAGCIPNTLTALWMGAADPLDETEGLGDTAELDHTSEGFHATDIER